MIVSKSKLIYIKCGCVRESAHILIGRQIKLVKGRWDDCGKHRTVREIVRRRIIREDGS